MKKNDLLNELKKREFVELKRVKIKKNNAEMLQKLEEFGMDTGAVIDVALNEAKLNKVVEEFEKESKKEDKEQKEQADEEHNADEEEIKTSSNF